MKQKHIGMILIGFGILLSLFVYNSMQREEQLIESFVHDQGTCFLDDGTCLHADVNHTNHILGFAMAIAMIFLGAYLIIADKIYEHIENQQKTISKNILKAKEKQDEDVTFQAFLKGFTKEEQSLLKAINSQDGIKQSTLRIKTGLSKTSVSLILKSLEEREIVSREKVGKTNKVFLREY